MLRVSKERRERWKRWNVLCVCVCVCVCVSLTLKEKLRHTHIPYFTLYPRGNSLSVPPSLRQNRKKAAKALLLMLL